MRISLRYALYLFLYSVFWNAMTVIVYRAFVLQGPLAVHAGPYFFLSGLILMVSGFLRMTRRKTLTKLKHRCPIIDSLMISGVVLILLSNWLGTDG